MTHSRSAEKRVRQSEAKRLRNRSVRGATRTRIRTALPLIGDGRIDEAQAAVRQAISSLDKAAEKGVIHANNAARRKSRLMLKLNAATATAATARAEEQAAKPARRAAKKAAAPAAAEKKTTRKAPAKKAPAKAPSKAKSK